MPKVEGPDLERYMDKHVLLKLNANRRVTGLLRGYDQFMNIVLEDTVEEISAEDRNNIGIVVCSFRFSHLQFIYLFQFFT